MQLDDGESPNTINKLVFNYQPHARHGHDVFAKSDAYMALADLIREVGGTDGFKYNLTVFYRYISSKDHSNLDVNYKALKRQLSSIIHDIPSGEK